VLSSWFDGRLDARGWKMQDATMTSSDSPDLPRDSDMQRALQDVVETAIAITGADFGNLQFAGVAHRP